MERVIERSKIFYEVQLKKCNKKQSLLTLVTVLNGFQRETESFEDDEEK